MASKVFGVGKRCLIQHTHRLLRNGAIEKPLWYDTALRYPPISPPPRTASKQITFPEDALLKRYYEKNPTARDEIIDTFDSASKVPAAIFVSKQLELMKEGIPEEDAYEMVESKLMNETEQKSSVHAPDMDTASMKEAFDRWVDAEAEFWQKSTERR
mmetsp:Transcript_1080/g.1278  ORF Transcript_1080/g.1278 Transcript_1080/m.1278 type:complete len:157 (-) Transcript_1080:273-743(-)|eukprot:CAMPEP_0184019384 /NCGR_PEP_ID=MMETSP0954-20121128/8722_1 /TAXON_ID=627963 /ORGANISM="Aplanochytrium sp, Strain PBS07" /LENGTH=156 /DNA_ID=CAMNT_0026301045 /DNA_START=80 /DNA_END=550 /DNA_ORIENTATION=-